jgi:hypothetical protein
MKTISATFALLTAVAVPQLAPDSQTPSLWTTRSLPTLALGAATLRILTAPAQTATLETAPRLRLVEELRIGSASDPQVGFSRIGSAAVDRDGNLYVFETQDLQIRVYGPAGQRVRTIGGRGSGPGEFSSAVSIGVKGDTVWTLGNASACGSRITTFRRNGELLGTSQAPGLRVSLRSDVVGVAAPLWMRSDGNFVSGEVRCTIQSSENTAIHAASDTVRVPRILFSAQGAVMDTLGWYLSPPAAPTTRANITIEGRDHPVPSAPAVSPLSVATIDGAYMVERAPPRTAGQATIRVTRTRLSGDTIFSRAFAYTPVRYTNVVLDSIAQASARVPGGFYAVIGGVQQRTQFANESAAAAAIRSRMSYPAFQMPVTLSFLSSDQTLWLRREEDGGANFHWVLFDAQGNLRGNLDIPRRYRLAWASGNVIWAIVPDDDDVPWMVKFRLTSN